MSTNLPPTAYVKMVDGWLIISLLKPFVDILVQTYRQTLVEDSHKRQVWTKKQMRRITDKICQIFLRVVYPVFFLVFILLFWLVGLIHYIIL